jgi:fructokinase
MEPTLKIAHNFHVGVELGGTSCKAAIFKSESKHDVVHFTRLHFEEFATSHEDPMETFNEMKTWLLFNLSGDSDDAIVPATLGIAAFGPICLDKTSDKYGCITTTPKLAWQNFPVYEKFKTHFFFVDREDCIFIDTDVNVCALFEYREAKVSSGIRESMCYVTVGTGVGIGLIVNNQCVHGMMHPEGGHVRVPIHKADLASGFQGVCPFHGDCLEGMVTNNSIKERLGLSTVADVADLPDDHQVWDTLAHYLGILCSNIYLTTSVERIILGGGVFKRSVLLTKTRKTFTQNINGYVKLPQIEGEALESFIVRPKYGDSLGSLAAAVCACKDLGKAEYSLN